MKTVHNGNKFTNTESEKLKKFIGEKIHRVKLLNLEDLAQAVYSLMGAKQLELKIFLFDSEGGQVQLFAPFQFETTKTRNIVFADDEKLINFANAVIVSQMANIDPELNTDKFKILE
jgi:hypothetical protein